MPWRLPSIPWSRVGWAALIAGPPLALGGVHPVVIALGALLGLAMGHAFTARHPVAARSSRRSLVLPRGWWIAGVPLALSIAQLVPGSHEVRRVVAPKLDAELATVFVVPPPTFALAPADAAVATGTLLVAGAVFFLAGQVSWTRTAGVLGGAGLVVALWAIVHGVAGADALFFVYEPRQVDMGAAAAGASRAWLGTFVNGNHQASYLLIALACSGALALDAARGEEQRRLRLWVAVMIVQGMALVLSGSRTGLVVGVVLAATLALLARRQLGRRPGFAASAVAFGVVGLLGLASIRGPLRELWAMNWGEALAAKLATVGMARDLLARSPLWGLGWGGFGELSAGVDPEGGAVMWAHVESMPVELAAAIGLPGAALTILAVVWWVGVHVRAHWARNANARLALVAGLIAVLVAALTDFALATAGVLVPFAALAGTVAERDPLPWSRARVRKALVLSTASAAVLVVAAGRHARVVRPTLPVERAALRVRPLDPMLHLGLARLAAEREDWSSVRTHASVAARLRPASVESHLWVAVAALSGEPVDAASGQAALGRGLRWLRAPAPPSLASWVAATWRPEQLAAVVVGTGDEERDTAAFRRLAWPLVEVSPRHARALAEARRARAPADPEPERIGHAVALAGKNAALALHHARVWQALEPGDGDAWLAIARAYRIAEPPRLDDAIAALDEGVKVVTEPAELGNVEEALTRALMQRGRASDLDRARAMLPGLRRRPATPEARRRRSALARALRE